MKIDKVDTSIYATINDFVSLKKQEKLIKDQLSILSPDVTTWLAETLDPEAKDKTVELPTGDKLTLVVGKDWQYPKHVSEEVKALKDKASKIQKIYQINNPKKWEPSTSVRFKEGGEK